MLGKTHLAIGAFVTIFFLPHVDNKFLFILVSMAASILPDIDSGFSTFGNKPIFRPLQFMTNHRGIIHSFSFCIFISFLIAYFYPIIAFPFFLGYSFHLLADSWTKEGIKPFWPFKVKSSGSVRVGGSVEQAIFFIFIVFDILSLIFYLT